MKNIAFTITGSGKICTVIEGKAYTVEKTHTNYDSILATVKEMDWNKFVSLVDLTSPIKAYLENSNTAGKVELNDGAITYEGEVIHNSLTNRILDFVKEGLPFEPLMNFLGNLMLNPSKRAVDELYDFLEAGELPITEDGYFLAYKNVNDNYMDIHSGTFDNSIGKVCKMPRNKVNDDKNETCSDGLHFCSIKYLPHFSASEGGHTMIVKINPRDCVSFPVDYNNTKGRCCEYEVVAEYTGDYNKEIEEGRNGFEDKVYSSKDGEIYGIKPSGQKFYNVRDEKGHFVKKDTVEENEEEKYFDYYGADEPTD